MGGRKPPQIIEVFVIIDDVIKLLVEITIWVFSQVVYRQVSQFLCKRESVERYNVMKRAKDKSQSSCQRRKKKMGKKERNKGWILEELKKKP